MCVDWTHPTPQARGMCADTLPRLEGCVDTPPRPGGESRAEVPALSRREGRGGEAPPLLSPAPDPGAGGRAAGGGMEGGGPPSPADGPFACPICLEALRDPVTLPCGHNFCLRCLGAHRDGPAPGAPRCPLCQEPFPAGLRLRKNHALSELLQLRRPMAPGPEPEAEPEPEAGAGAGAQADAEGPVLCDVCPAGQAAAAARSCLVCLASFCAEHLQPHRASAAFRAHRLAPPLRRLEERLCRRHLRPLDAYCRACPACVCPLCRAQDHRAHDVVPLEQERDLQEVAGGPGGRAGVGRALGRRSWEPGVWRDGLSCTWRARVWGSWQSWHREPWDGGLGLGTRDLEGQFELFLESRDLGVLQSWCGEAGAGSLDSEGQVRLSMEIQGRWQS